MVYETSGEGQQLVFFLRAQESRLQSRSQEINHMKDWKERSLAEARAREARLEVNTEKKIQEAVEAERRAARALSEERRQVHSEGLEWRLKEDIWREIRQVRAVVAEFAEARAENPTQHVSRQFLQTQQLSPGEFPFEKLP